MSTGLRVGHLLLLVRISSYPGRRWLLLSDSRCLSELGVIEGSVGLTLGTEALELGRRPTGKVAAKDRIARATDEALVKMEVMLAEKPMREDLARKVEVPDVAPGKAPGAYGTPASRVERQAIISVAGILDDQPPGGHKSLSVPSVARRQHTGE